MKHFVCAAMMAATTAIELERPLKCGGPVWRAKNLNYYGGNNDKVDFTSGHDFTIVFKLGSIRS
jgi:hypothetical protein